MNDPIWPDPRGLLDDLAILFAEIGAELRVVAPDDLIAGLARARLAHDYAPDATPFHLAALIFEGIATRHPLLDGNKRLAWLGATVFLGLNGLYLDAPERAAYEAGMKVIRREEGPEALAAFFEAWSVPWTD